MESESIKVDTVTTKREVSAAMTATRPEHRRELFLVWIKEVVLDTPEQEAEITFRVPLKGANCQSQERSFDNYILLKTKGSGGRMSHPFQSKQLQGGALAGPVCFWGRR
jgi:hypothetical protein